MPAEFAGPNGFARELFDGLPDRYDRLAELLSFGQNGRWRAAMVGNDDADLGRRLRGEDGGHPQAKASVGTGDQERSHLLGHICVSQGKCGKY